MSVTQYTLPCSYRIPKLRDNVYFISKSVMKVVNIDNGAADVTINNPNVIRLKGFDIRLNESESLDERYIFTKTLNISIIGHLTNSSFLMDDDYFLAVEDYDGNYYLINVDFPSKMTYTYTLNEGQNQTEFTFTSNSNFPLLKLNWNISKFTDCDTYFTSGVKSISLIEKGWARVDVEQDVITLFDGHTFKNVDFNEGSCTLTESYDGEKITNTISFDIPLGNTQSSWQYNLLEFKQNLYIAEIFPKSSSNSLIIGFETGLQPSYNVTGSTSNGDSSKITITLEETSQRGLEELINWSVVENTNKKWVYIKEINHKNAFTCIGHGLARYDYMAEVDQDGNEIGNYKRFSGATEENFPYLNVVGTFDDEVTFQSSVCNCSDEYVYKFNEHYYCVNGDKVQALESIHTYDCGKTGAINGINSPISDYTELGDVVESDSDFCEDEVEYIWVLKTDKTECITNTSRWVDVGYACSGETGYDKYLVQKEQIWDIELGWIDTDPLITAATLVEKDSEECGFIDFRKQYLTFIPLDDTTFTCSVPSVLTANTFEYSVDSGQTWTEWKVRTTTDTIRAGQKMYIREGGNYHDSQVCGIMGTIQSDGRFNVEGNIMSVIDGVNFSGITDFDFDGIGNGAFQSMFSGSRVVNAENLILPATDLAKSTQFVSNGGIRCYRAMFQGCTELVKAPRELPATTLEYGCYGYMFANCTSLTSIPNELPATAITEGCYDGMFEGCTAITESPIIRVERFTWQSVNYYSCAGMFSGCTSLTGITSYIEEPKWRETYNWVKDVAPQGVFRQPSSATTKWGVGDSGIPNGWIVEDIDTHIKYRWTESGTTCVGYDKYKNNIKEQSTDGGQTWTVVIPEVYSPSTLIEANSPDCGYTPPTPKFVLTLSDSSTVSAACDGTSAITSGQTSQYKTSTVSAVIYDCVSAISGRTFDGFRNLTSVTIPNTVTIISYSAFRNCYALTSLTIPNAVTIISYSAFTNCYALTSLTIPSSVKKIGDEAFKKCSGMTSLTINTGLEDIGLSAFANCSGLTSVTLPSSVTKIAGSAFYNCTSMTSITCLATTPPTLSGYYTFDNTNDCPIYVPAASVDAYKTAWNIWNNYYADRIRAIGT